MRSTGLIRLRLPAIAVTVQAHDPRWLEVVVFHVGMLLIHLPIDRYRIVLVDVLVARTITGKGIEACQVT